MYDSETHQQRRTLVRRVLVRQDLLQHLQGVFSTSFSVLVCPSRLNWCKPNFDCLVYPDLRVPICCFTVRNGTSNIVSSTLVASRGVTGQ